MKNNIKGNNKGFTLVELIVVIAVIGVLTVLLTPLLTGYIEKARKGTDENAIWEVAHAAEVAYVGYGKEEGVNELQVRIRPDGTALYAPMEFTFVEKVSETISGDDYVYKSKEYRGNTYLVSVNTSTGKATVTPKGSNSSLAGKLEETEIDLGWLGSTTAKDVVEDFIQVATGGVPFFGKIYGGYEMQDSDWEKVDEVAFEMGATSDVLKQKADEGDTQFFIDLLNKAGIQF